MAGRQDRDLESRRILERVERETAPGGTSAITRAARNALDHVAAADTDRPDPIEYWGTRIGRALGLLIALGLMVWLVLFVARGG